MNKLQKSAEELLSYANIEINGNNNWDIKVHNEKFYQKVFSKGSLGLGESYMDGDWDSQKLDEFFYRVIRSDLDKKVMTLNDIVWQVLIAKVKNFQSKSRSFEVGKKHYDVGDELYKNMLGKKMVYTCGYWKNAKSLDEAQEKKLKLVCDKLGLKEGMEILDIGSGWAEALKYAAENYGVKGVGITISKNQAEFSKRLCKDLPIEIRLQDYRDTKGKFDRIFSLGMFEHVGYKNYKKYMGVVNNCLKDDGLFLLHTIGGNKSKTSTDAWIHEYIFPNGMIPSMKQISKASEGLFVIEDWHNFGTDYDKTLMAWHKNFNKNWNKIKSNYDERFKRMWNYYLLSCAGVFRARENQLWQIVFSKNGVKGGYESVR